MDEATNQARAEEDQGKDEDKIENKVCIFQSLESKEIEEDTLICSNKEFEKIIEVV